MPLVDSAAHAGGPFAVIAEAAVSVPSATSTILPARARRTAPPLIGPSDRRGSRNVALIEPSIASQVR
jgi:hypothetical protein